MARGILNVELHYQSFTFVQIGMTEGRAMPQAVSRRPVIADAWVQCLASPYGIRGGHSGTGSRFIYRLRCIVSALTVLFNNTLYKCDSVQSGRHLLRSAKLKDLRITLNSLAYSVTRLRFEPGSAPSGHTV